MTRKITGEKRVSKTGKLYYNYYKKKQKGNRLTRLLDRIINWYWRKRIIEPDARED